MINNCVNEMIKQNILRHKNKFNFCIAQIIL